MALKEAAFRIFSLKVQFPLCNSATHWTVRGGTKNRVPGSQPCRSTTDNTHHSHGHDMFIIDSLPLFLYVNALAMVSYLEYINLKVRGEILGLKNGLNNKK